MKIKKQLSRITALLTLLLSLVLSGCSGPGIYGLTVIAEDQLEVESGEQVYGDLILLEGQIQMEPLAETYGNLYIAGGSAQINGTVYGDVVLLFGDLELGNQGRIEGDLMISGGSSTIAPQAIVSGEISTAETTVALFEQGGEEETSNLGWLAAMGLLYVLAAYVFVRYRPQPVRRIQAVFLEHSLAALAMGLLGWVVLPSLLLLMISTLVLLPVALLLALALLLTIFFGWIALSLIMGERLAKLIKRPLSPGLAAAAGAVLLLVGIYLVSLIPLINVLTAGFLAIISLGAILLTRFGISAFSPPVDQTPQEPYSTET